MMGEQPQLDFRAPIARRDDPQTSKAAEAEYTFSGRRQLRCLQVLDLVVRHPGHTANEYARMFHRDYPELPITVSVATPGKRLPDLEKLGMVYKGATRECGDTGREVHTWWYTDLGMKNWIAAK